MNSFYWWFFLLLHYLLVVFFLRFWGTRGLWALMPLMLLLGNLQVQIQLKLFGLSATLGNSSYAVCFLITDYLSECRGKSEARKMVLLGLASQLASLVIMLAVLRFEPLADDTAYAHLAALFTPVPQLLFASLLAYLVSQWCDVGCYEFFKNRLPQRRWLWLRNNGSTLLSQAVDTVIFVFFAFSFGPLRLDWPIIWEIMISTYLLKSLIAVLDTPFLYLMTAVPNGKLRRLRSVLS